MPKQKDTGFLETFGETLAKHCFQNELPFCTVACPFHLDIKELEPKWEGGRWNAAYRSFQTSVGFPAIVQRLCSRPCEKACILKDRGGTLSIGAIEEAVIRLARRKAPNAYNLPRKDKRVAVIGGGLSGLGCALRLCNKKYEVTIYEGAEVPGGRARNRMDSELFDEEIRSQFAMEEPIFRLKTRVTESLFADICAGFDAVYVATGEGGETFGLSPSGTGAFASGREGIFLGGALLGADDVRALADGLRAALAIERYLKTGLMNEPFDTVDTKLMLDPAMIPEVPAVSPRDPSLGFSEEETRREAGRCCRCSCDRCVRECDLMRIQQKTPGRLYEESYITVRPSTLANDGRWATRRIASCDQCGLCRTVCPSRIDMGEFLLQSHRGLRESNAMPWAFHDYWLRDMQFSTGEAALLIPPEVQGQGEGRPLVLFPGCQMGASDPRYVKDAFAWLRRHRPGSGLWLNCCGAPARWAAEEELYAAHGEEMGEQWRKMGSPTLVFTCPTCRSMMERSNPEIPGVFLEELLVEWGLPEQEEHREGVTYAVFDPCASRNYPGLQRAVRELAGQLAVPTRELSHSGSLARCCGYGGQTEIAAPEYVGRVRRERVEESPLPYITYCVNCRDVFASRGKEAVHILDLAFGRRDGRREPPTLTARLENRRRLKRELVALCGKNAGNGSSQIECGEGTLVTQEEKTMLITDQKLEKKLSDSYILVSDMEEVVAFCEREGRGVVNPENGHITGHKKIGHMTYWAEYEVLSDGGLRLWNGYAHRMNLEGE